MAKARHYTDEELTKLRQIQMDIYHEIERICANHDIPFVTIAGTALGAVRHNGFIPWDDDLDIAMMRSDYTRFLEYANGEINPGFFVQNYYTDSYYGNYFTKIRRNGTLFEQNIDKKDQSHHGIFVDVFPIDRVTDNPHERKKYQKKLMISLQMYMAKCNKGISGEVDSFKGKIKHLIRLILHGVLVFASKEKLFNKLNDLCQIYNTGDSGTLMNSVVFAMTGGVFDAETMFPAVKHDFEGDTILIPRDADRYLSQTYGNYMELPPVEQRTNHRPVQLSFGDAK
ncbi:MAG: LicD family protein [Lachnospiraceae bacterium]|nr:LicD family protein [Lachnospiraceae bacterium]